MNENVRLGRIGGVAVGVNWSVLAIFLLIVWGLAAGRFPLLHPEVGTVWHVVAGLATGCVFLLSLLAHEVSHAVVAIRNGVEVDGITLWMFGGVARLRGEAPGPGAQFRIAAVGPLVSVVLGAVFLGLYALVEGADLAGDAAIVSGALQWLGVINLALAVFNLMPAAPLDGGRILKSVLWRWRGDRRQAAITAAKAGKVFGGLVIALGLFQFVATAAFGGLWLVFIGWFLVMAASAEEQHARVRDALAGVHVRDVMTADPVAVSPGLTVDDFISDYAMRHRFSGYPLLDDGQLRGLVTLNRVREVPAARRGQVRLDEVACPPEEVPTAGPDEPLGELLERMSRCTDGRAVVLADDRVIGIVSPTDVARRLEVADLHDTGAHV